MSFHQIRWGCLGNPWGALGRPWRQAAALQMMHYAGMGVPMAPAGMHGLYGMPQPLEPAPQP